MRGVLVLLLLPALLAGCTLPTQEEAPPRPQVFPTDLNGCRVAVGLIPVPAERFADRMPAGWSALQTEDMGLPDDPRGDGILGVWMMRCASGYGGNVTDAPYASYFTVVEPRADVLVEDAEFHFLKWETLVPDPAVRDALRQAGAPAFEGSADFGPNVPVAAAFQAAFEMNGTHVLRATGPVPSYPDLSEFTYAEYQRLPARGYAVWRATATSDPLTVGGVTIDLPARSYAAQVVQGTRADGYVLVGQSSFTDATVTIPP